MKRTETCCGSLLWHMPRGNLSRSLRPRLSWSRVFETVRLWSMKSPCGSQSLSMTMKSGFTVVSWNPWLGTMVYDFPWTPAELLPALPKSAHCHTFTQRRLRYFQKVVLACPRRKCPSECRKTPVKVHRSVYRILAFHLLEVAYECLSVARQGLQKLASLNELRGGCLRSFRHLGTCSRQFRPRVDSRETFGAFA